MTRKKKKDSDDVCHYKVKYKKQHAGQPKKCWKKYRICKKDEYSHINWSTQIKMDSSKKNITCTEKNQA